MKVLQKVILPQAFKANAVASGIKKSGKLDLALFYSQVPAKAACLFTTNKIQAAPINLCRQYLKKSSSFQALMVNSGNANAFTGKAGLSSAQESVKSLARVLKIKDTGILVASTGVIGKPFPLEKIKKAIPQLVSGLSVAGIGKAKKAILTTDTFTKEMALECRIGKEKIIISAVAKGAGMIAPNLATMLVFIFTDAKISSHALAAALKIAAEKSFNCITIDGCMSTNDMLAILANGAAANKIITGGKALDLFSQALSAVCLRMAELIVRDAEGASKFIRIKVSGAKNFTQAKCAALAIANSNLFKTAVYGENPNFGRIVASVGASGIVVKEEGLKIKVSPLSKKDIVVNVSINQGHAGAQVLTSDLTPEYIKINAEYN